MDNSSRNYYCATTVIRFAYFEHAILIPMMPYGYQGFFIYQLHVVWEGQLRSCDIFPL